MASKKTDPFDLRIRKPRSLKIARLMGETLILGLDEIARKKTGRELTEADLGGIARLGHLIGEKMFCEKATWTGNRFLGELYRLADNKPVEVERMTA